jgi:hypothetical protein
MGEAGRRHIIEHFGWRTVGAQMEALYDDVIRTRRRSADLNQSRDQSTLYSNERH